MPVPSSECVSLAMKRASAHPRSVSPEPRPVSWTSDLTVPHKLPKDADVSSVAPSEAGTEVEARHHIKYGKPLQAVWGLFSEYANNSSIHGVRYMGEKRRPLAERVWWIIAFCFSIYGCSKLILNVWNKWDQSPVIVSFAEKSTPVWQIPFPAGKGIITVVGGDISTVLKNVPWIVFHSNHLSRDKGHFRDVQLHPDVPHPEPDYLRQPHQ